MSLCCPSGVIKNNNNNNNYAVPYKTQRQHTEFNEQHVDQMHHVYMFVHRYLIRYLHYIRHRVYYVVHVFLDNVQFDPCGQ